MKKSQLIDYMSLHILDFIFWGVLDNAPLYCITLWIYYISPLAAAEATTQYCKHFLDHYQGTIA
jgi:hypothetical protein